MGGASKCSESEEELKWLQEGGRREFGQREKAQSGSRGRMESVAEGLVKAEGPERSSQRGL